MSGVNIPEILNNAEKTVGIAKEGVGLIDKLLSVFPSYTSHQQFIKEVENRPNLTAIEKICLLEKWKEINRELKNRVDIYNKAKQVLLNDKNQDNFEEKINNVDDEWLGIFNDIIKNVSDEEMQIVWAKILAGKCDNNKSISKKTILILQTIESDMADVFSCLCANTLIYKDTNDKNDEGSLIFLYTELEDVDEVFTEESSSKQIKRITIYNSKFINLSTLTQLSELGLINIMPTFDRKGLSFNEAIITHYDKKVHLKSPKDNISIGSIEYTTCGEELVKILYNGVRNLKNDNLPQAVIDYYNSKGYSAEFI